MALQSHSIIKISGEEIPSFESYSIKQDIGKHHVFEVVCRLDVLEDETGTLATLTQDYLGEPINISTTPDYQTSDYETLNFQGIITEITNSKDFKDAESDLVIIKGFSNTIICDDGPHNISHEEKSLDQIVTDTLSAYDQQLLMVEASPRNTTTIAYSVQQNESTFGYLKRLSEQYGEWFYYNGISIIFGAPEEDEPLELKHTINLKQYSLSLKPLVAKYKFLTNDYLNEEVVEKRSSDIASNASGLTQSVTAKSEQIFSVETQRTLNTFSDATLQSRVDNYVELAKKGAEINQITARGICDNPGVFIGQMIKIMDGEVSQGNFRIISIKHSCNYLGDYENQFVGVSGDLDAYPNTNINAFPKSGTQIAKVIDNVDPEGISRIKVQFPWQVALNLSTPWLRVLTPSSGADKGFHFIPEVEDEVLIGFEGDNAERPYVMGALYTGNNKPEEWQSDANNVKAIRTRSGHTIELNDTEGEEKIQIYDNEGSIIIFDTQAKSLTINATEDIEIGAKNIRIVAEENIDIQAQGDITKAAQGNVTIQSQGNTDIQATGDASLTSSGAVSVEATSDATLSGANATVSGQAAAELNGAQAKVSGSAMAEVSGGIVKIN